MCGIAGIMSCNPSAPAPSIEELTRINERMSSRGPDGEGFWRNEDDRIAFAHRRLSIIEVSEAGAQPMHDISDRYVITYNGEIYNYKELRAELECDGVNFKGYSDTEVILNLFALYGERMLTKLRGMFAFAIWNKIEKRLFIARDQYGIKPLYTSFDGWHFRFASSVQALIFGGGVEAQLDAAGVVGFLIFGSVPEPRTLHRHISCLPAGCFQYIDRQGVRPPVVYEQIQSYFDRTQRSLPEAELRSFVREAVSNSLRAHLVADVDVGLFLSAGIDSGVLLALWGEIHRKPPQTFTIGFEEFIGSDDDEMPIAARVAEKFGATHNAVIVKRNDFHNELTRISEEMDQPSIDGVNTWLVAKAARESGIKVAISGVGGDELFGGYPSFDRIPKMIRLFRAPAIIPGLGKVLRLLADSIGLNARNPKYNYLFELGGTIEGAYLLNRALFLPAEIREQLNKEFFHSGMRALGTQELLRSASLSPSASTSTRISSMESSLYMKNQLLKDSDWAGMANGVEVRTPLVDIELLRTLSPYLSQIHTFKHKRLLSECPTESLPEEVIQRPKSGFFIPLGDWTSKSKGVQTQSKGQSSREWARALLSMRMIESLEAR